MVLGSSPVAVTLPLCFCWHLTCLCPLGNKKQTNLSQHIRTFCFLFCLHVFQVAIATIILIIFWDFLMFYQIFLSPKEKRSAIISNKHGTCELPHELPNDSRFRKLRKVRKISKFHRIITQCQSSCQNKNFVDTSKGLLKNRN